MRVIHFATTSVMHKAFNLPLARYQRNAGMTVEFGCGEDIPPGYESAVADLEAAGFTVHVVPFAYAIRPFADAAALVRLVRFFRRERFDVVHTHTSKAGVLVRLAARLAGAPYIVHTVHELHFREFAGGPKRAVFAAVERWIARATDVLLFTNPVIRDLADQERIAGRRPGRIVGAPLRELTWFSVGAGEAAAFRASQDLPAGPFVASVARLVSFKGIDTLVEAAALLAVRRPGLRVVVLGGGPLEADLRALAERRGVADVVRFLGFREDDRDVVRLLANADVFCLPTRREGLGIAFVEAMAMGLPVVGPAMPPITSVVDDGRTGLLVTPDDPAAYAEALDRLLGDAELRRRLGDEGRRRAHALFDPERMFEAVNAAYLH
jgi:glycosyltransferase involved in cell wall biosynthesis